jgi:hypothetical protein
MTTAMPNIKFMNKYDLQESDDIVIPDENYTMVWYKKEVGAMIGRRGL